MRFKVYMTMEFCKEIEADSEEEVYNMAGDINFSWEDWIDEEISDVVEVKE